jgi:hypothetical protein
VKAVVVSTNSWHYRILTHTPWWVAWDKEYLAKELAKSPADRVPKSLCSYFWAVVACLTMVPFAWVMFGSIYACFRAVRLVIRTFWRFALRPILTSIPDVCLDRAGITGKMVIASKRRVCPRIEIEES